ncbi:uncharacterized protein BDZ99DRAFT_523473 [Mytilinidion resinicola]|uniref:ABM domain-containing protein n=1 Tax=Mytilinidion resinicola TaxID=574789 RepID=A0A6A6YDL0_9PEZI|nr:uncharacterized protein BDZ99DRAFT_523473 [Mytilinidion resinicola]KAF2806912.1 hypothetical protein BDZ99DRAFT_523473 [Mytilinidion resinicola]
MAISLLNTITPKEGKLDIVKEAILKFMDFTTQKYPDCLGAELLYDEDGEQLVLIMAFKTQDSINTFLREPYVLSLKKGLPAESVDSMEVTTYERVGNFSR